VEVIRLILTPIWKVWFLLVFTVCFLLLYPFFWLALQTRQLHVAFFLKKVWAAGIVFFSGIVPVIRYADGKKYRLPKQCVIVCNHTSYLDIVLSVFYIRHLALFMGKTELLKVPLFCIFFKKMDIPVDRRSRMGSHKAFMRAAEEIDKGNAMIIYPEGTIASDGKLKPFKNGAFKLAIDKQIPIIPVTNLNNWELLQNGGFFKSFGRPGLARIVVHPPISTVGMTEENLVDLRHQVYNLTKETLEHYGSKH